MAVAGTLGCFLSRTVNCHQASKGIHTQAIVSSPESLACSVQPYDSLLSHGSLATRISGISTSSPQAPRPDSQHLWTERLNKGG